jgi:hypothetical protein
VAAEEVSAMGLFRRRPPRVIDLRDHVLAAQRAAERYEFGYPTRCPVCGGGGYLDHIDLFRMVQHEHCPRCEFRWERSEQEILALNR